MAGPRRTVTIEIGGQKFPLRTDADDGYVKALAALVNEKIDEVRAGARTLSTQSVTVLAALQLADELETMRRKHAELKRQVRERGARILELLPSTEKG
jgi:cell division protein ZapA